MTHLTIARDAFFNKVYPIVIKMMKCYVNGDKNTFDTLASQLKDAVDEYFA